MLLNWNYQNEIKLQISFEKLSIKFFQTAQIRKSSHFQDVLTSRDDLVVSWQSDGTKPSFKKPNSRRNKQNPELYMWTARGSHDGVFTWKLLP